METSVKIRRLCLVEGRTISSVARQFNLSRNTVRKYLKHADPPRYQRTVPRESPKLEEFKDQLEKWLEDDGQRPVRERRNAIQLFSYRDIEGLMTVFNVMLKPGRDKPGHLNRRMCRWCLRPEKPASLIGPMSK